jgi:hypothetical protein
MPPGIESIAESTTVEDAVRRVLPERRRARAGLVVAAHLRERLDPHRVALLAEERRHECASMAFEAIDGARRLTLSEQRPGR